MVGYGILLPCHQISPTGSQPVSIGNKLVMLCVRTALDNNLVIRQITVAVLNLVGSG